jgi:hypothetical protein
LQIINLILIWLKKQQHKKKTLFWKPFSSNLKNSYSVNGTATLTLSHPKFKDTVISFGENHRNTLVNQQLQWNF